MIDEYIENKNLTLADMCKVLRLENILSSRRVIKESARSGQIPFIIGASGMEFPTHEIESWLSGEWQPNTPIKPIPLKIKDEPPKPKPSRGFVYLFQCERLYKIGKSKNPAKRLKALQSTIGAYPIEMIHKISCADMREAENSLHQRYAQKRERGEWFRLSKKEVEFIKGIKEL